MICSEAAQSVSTSVIGRSSASAAAQAVDEEERGSRLRPLPLPDREVVPVDDDIVPHRRTRRRLCRR